jgi:transglutaminase-like putative cysteine protease
MLRTALLGLLPLVVLAWSWLRLEDAKLGWSILLWGVAIGIGPALLPRRGWRLAAVPIAALVGLYYAFGTASPREAWRRAVDGFYLFYDVALPFSAAGAPRMHALVLVAVLGFTLAVSLAVAERRALLASGLLVAGAAWPATLLTSSNTFARGAVILAAALTLLAGMSSAARARQAAVVGALVVASAVGLASVPAVAKGAFLGWETWEPSREDLPVSVSYVWDTNYGALVWPAKKTTVLTIEAPPVSRYWRATTLDVFNGHGWLQSTLEVQRDPVFDPLMPAIARRESQQLRADVKVQALQDIHLIAASVPVRYEADFDTILYQSTGTAYVPGGVPRGSTYTSWSYAARPSPARLAQSRPIYPSALDRHLVVQSRTFTPPSPHFGARGRAAAMEQLFADNPNLNEYRPLYQRALTIAGDAPSPYAAVIALETWLRDGQRFVYDQSPETRGDLPPLVEFVSRTHRGYCQHFAGAMALMLRFLGIPARIGAGFTSGTYNREEGRWTVVDREAHTWVEVWFRGHGWVPFDPTPGRGQLDGSYSAASLNFDANAVTAAIAAGLGELDAADFKLDAGRFDRATDAARDTPGRDLPGDVSGTSSGGSEGSLLKLLALAALALGAGIALLKLGLRRARYLTRDPRRVAAAVRRELDEFLSDQRLDVPESATVEELGQLLRAHGGIEPSAFVSAVNTARYGRPEHAAEAARRARRELRRIERVLRRQLSVWERARGLVSVRSLGLT